MEKEELQKKYYSLKADWEKATLFLSSGGTNLVEFHELVALGPDIIPFILKDLLEEQSWIVLALYRITSERPSQERKPGNLPSIVTAWLLWGDEKGYI